MKPGIQARLFLAFAGALAIVVAAMVLAVNWSFQRGLEDYLRQVELSRLGELTEALAQAYAAEGGWDFLRHNPRAWRDIVNRGLGARAGTDTLPARRPPPPHPPRQFGRPPAPPGMAGQRQPPYRPPPAFDRHPQADSQAPRRRPPPPPPPIDRPGPMAQNPLDLTRRLRLFDGEGALVFGPDEVAVAESRIPVPLNGETVGYLALRQRESVSDESALGFQAGQRRTYGLIAALALALSALLSLILSRRLLRPIRRITVGARRLGEGRYATRIPVDRSDELGRLAEDFNHLAAALEQNEQTRRQWVADISHELRTPLAILRGEIEALLDGVRQASPERMQSLHAEVMSLGKLVDDLYELALSDLGALDYKRESLDLAISLDAVVDTFTHRFAAKQLGLHNQVKGPLPLSGDPRRLQQLFTNLLENSQRYTDPGGRLVIRLESETADYHLVLEDTAPGVPESALPRLFERLYRVDKSRSRSLGGAGLGLAICRNIVEAHGGRIDAKASRLGGLAVHIRLPRDARRHPK